MDLYGLSRIILREIRAAGWEIEIGALNKKVECTRCELVDGLSALEKRGYKITQAPTGPVVLILHP